MFVLLETNHFAELVYDSSLAHEAILLTRNQKDFDSIPRLRVENWLD